MNPKSSIIIRNNHQSAKAASENPTCFFLKQAHGLVRVNISYYNDALSFHAGLFLFFPHIG